MECKTTLILVTIAMLIFIIALSSMAFWASKYGTYKAEDSAAAARIHNWSIGLMVTAVLLSALGIASAISHHAPTIKAGYTKVVEKTTKAAPA